MKEHKCKELNPEVYRIYYTDSWMISYIDGLGRERNILGLIKFCPFCGKELK